jgi:hypothetical protein
VSDPDAKDPKADELAGEPIGRRDTLRLATLAAALGAGLSVSLHADEAHAEGEVLQFKFYRQVKDQAQLVYTATLPVEASKTLLSAPGLVQVKGYQKDMLVGSGQMQLKIVQSKTTTYDVNQPKGG